MNLRSWLAATVTACVLSVVAACSSTSASNVPPPNAEVAGAVQGYGIPDGFATALGVPADGTLSVLISTRVHGCGARTGSFRLRNAVDLELVREAGAELRPGVYQVAIDARGGDFMEATLHTSNGACVTVGDASLAQSGTVTLREVTAEAVRGTFDVVFAQGERLTGSFDAPLCVGAAPAGPPGECI